jgi:hypothetical protein
MFWGRRHIQAALSITGPEELYSTPLSGRVAEIGGVTLLADADHITGRGFVYLDIAAAAKS